eukprot:1562182-Rhodomonas_salina.1
MRLHYTSTYLPGINLRACTTRAPIGRVSTYAPALHEHLPTGYRPTRSPAFPTLQSASRKLTSRVSFAILFGWRARKTLTHRESDRGW